MSVLETVTVDNVPYDMHDPKVGSGTLSTSAQTLIPAVNELAVPIGKIGSGTLNTTNKTIIPAINEVFTNVSNTVFQGTFSATRNAYETTQSGTGIQITLPYACILLALSATFSSNTSGRSANWALTVNGVAQPSPSTNQYRMTDRIWCPAGSIIKAIASDYGVHINVNASITGSALVFPTVTTPQTYGTVSHI